jgi:hypothetical protein
MSIALTALMQRLAIKSLFDKRQSLTAISDSLTSWSGLGSSLLTVYRNYRLPAALIPVLIITGYLSSLTALHTTTPLLFSVPATLIPMSNAETLVKGTLDIEDLFPQNYTLPPNFSNVTFDWYLSSAGVVIPDNFSEITLPGLLSNRIFDSFVINDGADLTSAEAPFTDFHITCGQFPERPNVTLTSATPLTDGRILYSLEIIGTHNSNVLSNLSDTFWVSRNATDAEEIVSNLWTPGGGYFRLFNFYLRL